MDIEWIRIQIKEDQYLWTVHADEERRSDGLEINDVEGALLQGKVLERYPHDPRGVSCLVCGESQGTPIHAVCGKNKMEQMVIITVYIPREPKWRTPTERSKK